MEYKNENKLAGNLKPGDFVTLTGYADDAAEVEYVRPSGPNKKKKKTEPQTIHPEARSRPA